jgi:integrase
MASLKKRGKVYYAQYYQGERQRRICLHTTSLQVAKEKVRQIESAQFRGSEIPLPTRTPLPKLLTAYVEYLEAVKRPRNVQKDVHYLRSLFGPICPALEHKNDKIARKAVKRPATKDVPVLEAAYLEQMTTAEISQFLATRVRRKGLSPKTANHYRQILTRVFNWAMEQYGVRMPDNLNPAAKVERYREPAPEIRFMTKEQIREQFDALGEYPQLQTMVAVFIYAGLRREEALWLTVRDVDLKSGPYGMIRVQAKTLGGKSWEPKTRVNRVVPVSSMLREYLDKYQVSESDHGWFFPSPEGTRWDIDNFSRSLSRVNGVAKLPWACLDYRHTFGSQLAMKGESLYKISKLMGNSPDICRRHYAALVPEEMVGSVEF